MSYAYLFKYIIIGDTGRSIKRVRWILSTHFCRHPIAIPRLATRLKFRFDEQISFLLEYCRIVLHFPLRLPVVLY